MSRFTRFLPIALRASVIEPESPRSAVELETVSVQHKTRKRIRRSLRHVLANILHADADRTKLVVHRTEPFLTPPLKSLQLLPTKPTHVVYNQMIMKPFRLPAEFETA